MKKIIQIFISVFVLCLLVILLISISPDFTTDPKTTLIQIQDHNETKFDKVIQCLTNKEVAFEVAQDQNKPTEIRVDKEVYKKAKGCL